MKTIVLTGGGTAGHVMPNIALIPFLQREGYTVHYVGAKDGMERGLIEPIPGVTYHGISTGKLRRYFSMKNFSDPFRVLAGVSQSRKLLKRIKPDVVFAKGGFVVVPVVYAAKSLGIPIVLHESDYTCGLANRLCLSRAKTICVSFEPTLQHLKGKKGVWTGSPIRQDLLTGSAEKAQAFCQFPNPEKPWVFVMGGSLGSLAINKAVREAVPELCRSYNIVHQCGKGNTDETVSHPNYRQYEFIRSEMADLYNAADIVVCRSGANTLFELLTLQKPAIFIPLPASASRGDQIVNARYFEKLGYSMVLMQEEVTTERLAHDIALAVVGAPKMKQSMAESPVSDGTQNVLKQIYKAAGGTHAGV